MCLFTTALRIKPHDQRNILISVLQHQVEVGAEETETGSSQTAPMQSESCLGRWCVYIGYMGIVSWSSTSQILKCLLPPLVPDYRL